MGFRFRTTALVVALVLLAPAAFACSFQIVDRTEVTYTEPDGTQTTYITNYWAWVNCGGSGSVGTVYDPTPPGGGVIGPPAPPPPPAPPTVSACDICQDACWGEWSLCMSSEQNTNWFGFCGILCRESCRVFRDSCTGSCFTDGRC